MQHGTKNPITKNFCYQWKFLSLQAQHIEVVLTFLNARFKNL